MSKAEERPQRRAMLGNFDDIMGLCDSDGIAFRAFVIDGRPVLKEMERHIAFAQGDEPEAVQDDKSLCIGWLGYANSHFAKALSYEKRAMGLCMEKLRLEEKLSANQAKDEAAIYCWQFKEEKERWEAVAGALQERIWTARKSQERWNQERPVVE